MCFEHTGDVCVLNTLVTFVFEQSGDICACLQVNEETANRRPIMLALPTKEEREMKEAAAKQENSDAKEKTPSGEKSKWEEKVVLAG